MTPRRKKKIRVPVFPSSFVRTSWRSSCLHRQVLPYIINVKYIDNKLTFHPMLIMDPEARYEVLRNSGAPSYANVPWKSLPRDIKNLVYRASAGGLMKFALTSRMHADLAKNDQVWKSLFERDYPHDYKFCRRILPFYVIDNRQHPLFFWGEPSDAQPPWKRYYLHTANAYHNLAVELHSSHGSELRAVGARQLNMLTATSEEVHLWCHQVAANVHLETFDRRADVAWMVVRLVVAATWRSDEPMMDDAKISEAFFSVAHREDWLLDYLTHAMSKNHQGRGRINDTLWDEIRARRPAWQGKPTLFDYNSLQLMETFMRQFHLNEYMLDHVIRAFAVLNDAYYSPCIWSFGHPGLVRFAFMARESDYVRIYVGNHILQDRATWKSMSYTLANILRLGSSERIRKEIRFFTSLCLPYDVIESELAVDIEYDIAELLKEYSRPPRTRDGQILYLGCASCGEDNVNLLLKCGGLCEQDAALYCSVTCQQAHWSNGHHKVCGVKAKSLYLA